MTGVIRAPLPTSRTRNGLIVGVGLLCQLSLLLATAYFVMRMFTLDDESRRAVYRMELLARDIMLFDEVLTMSARMAAFTGDLDWEQRYRLTEPQLGDALAIVMRLAPAAARDLAAVNVANEALLKIEKDAFILVREGDINGAATLLLSKRYADLKTAYSAGLNASLKHLDQARHNFEARQQSALTKLLILNALLLFGFVALGAYLIFYIVAIGRGFEQLSITDDLTGLFNRRYFNLVFEREIARAARERRVYGLAMIDVDYFKRFNDTYGHARGDEVLARVARTLNEHMRRAEDNVFRMGGEEFAFIASAKSTTALAEFTERLREKVVALAIEHTSSPNEPWVTVSIGLRMVEPDDTCDPEALLREADEALYAAKAAGRNRVMSWREAGKTRPDFSPQPAR